MTYQGKETVATSQDTSKPDLTSTTMLRLILDYADDVEEAIALISSMICMIPPTLLTTIWLQTHRETAQFWEWVNGTDQTDNDGSKRELRITRNEKPYQTVTNFILVPGYYEEGDEPGGLDVMSI